VATLVGTYLCYLPALFVIWIFMFYTLFVMDQGAGPIASLTGSARLVFKAPGEMLLFGLIYTGIFIAGMCMLLVGLIPAVAVLDLGIAWLYLRLSGRQRDQDISGVFA
jgi:uncharacterized membrane protein